MRICCNPPFESYQVIAPLKLWKDGSPNHLQLIEIQKQDGWPVYLFTYLNLQFSLKPPKRYAGLVISTRDRAILPLAHVDILHTELFYKELWEESPIAQLRLERTNIIHEILPRTQNTFSHSTNIGQSFFLYNPSKFPTVQAVDFPVLPEHRYKKKKPFRQSYVEDRCQLTRIPISWPFSFEEMLELQQQMLGGYYNNYTLREGTDTFWSRVYIDVSERDCLFISAYLEKTEPYCIYFVDFAERRLLGCQVDHFHSDYVTFLATTKQVHETEIEYMIVSEIFTSDYSGIDFTTIKVPR